MRGWLVVFAIATGVASPTRAQDAPAPPEHPERPVPGFNRWQEDWSVLSDPALRTAPLDELKYVPLSSDGTNYLSLGLNLRTRYERNDTRAFGIGEERRDDYAITRAEAHVDLRLGDRLQLFGQLVEAFTSGKRRIGPPDRNRLDLAQGFVALVQPLGGGTLKLRAGRQQFAFDLQRFVSARDGPNVRQSYDALWGDYEIGSWRFIGFYSQPVQNADRRPFDDRSSGRLTLSGLRIEHQVMGDGELSAYWSRYTEDGAEFPSVTGDERRDVFDIRFAGRKAGWDWDWEAMVQTGRVAARRVRAWAVGSRTGYGFAGTAWRPRIGLQVDLASGDGDPGDAKLGTFNPLFPNGYYLTLAGYTGYSNFVHVKPSVTVHPTEKLTATLAGAAQWRMTAADAIYAQPLDALAGTAGRGGRWTGAYAQGRVDWSINANVSAALETVHFEVGSAVRDAGGRAGNYLGLELKLEW